MPSQFIRVKDKATGHEYSIREHLFNGDAHTKSDRPAVGPDGEVVPPKHKTTVRKSAAAKQPQSGQKAESKKENS